jgi:hypothetical protein
MHKVRGSPSRFSQKKKKQSDGSRGVIPRGPVNKPTQQDRGKERKTTCSYRQKGLLHLSPPSTPTGRAVPTLPAILSIDQD